MPDITIYKLSTSKFVDGRFLLTQNFQNRIVKSSIRKRPFHSLFFYFFFFSLRFTSSFELRSSKTIVIFQLTPSRPIISQISEPEIPSLGVSGLIKVCLLSDFEAENWEISGQKFLFKEAPINNSTESYQTFHNFEAFTSGGRKLYVARKCC